MRVPLRNAPVVTGPVSFGGHSAVGYSIFCGSCTTEQARQHPILGSGSLAASPFRMVELSHSRFIDHLAAAGPFRQRCESSRGRSRPGHALRKWSGNRECHNATMRNATRYSPNSEPIPTSSTTCRQRGLSDSGVSRRWDAAGQDMRCGSGAGIGNATMRQCAMRQGTLRFRSRFPVLLGCRNRRISNKEGPITKEKSKRRQHPILGSGSRVASPFRIVALWRCRIPYSSTTWRRRGLSDSGVSRRWDAAGQDMRCGSGAGIGTATMRQCAMRQGTLRFRSRFPLHRPLDSGEAFPTAV